MTEQHFRTYLLAPGEVWYEYQVVKARHAILHVEPDIQTQVLQTFDLLRISAGTNTDGPYWCFENLTNLQVPISLRIRP